MYGHSVEASHYQHQEEEDPFRSFEEIEAQTIRNLLSDDDDLLSGVTDGLDYKVQPGGVDDAEELDFFSSVRGMELGEDGVASTKAHPNGEHPLRTLFVKNINSNVKDPELRILFELLFSNLDKSSIEHVLRQLCKLPWSECESYLLKHFLKVHKGKYGQIHLIASLTAGLSRYHDEFAIDVVDEVLEEFCLGLEINKYGMEQRRIAHMRQKSEQSATSNSGLDAWKGTNFGPTLVQDVVDSCRTTNVIFSLELGYKYVIIPIFAIAISIFVSFSFAAIYIIAVAALGILSTSAIGLAIDAYGPISDNAGGIVEMAGMSHRIRERTYALDAARSYWKGFAIGSAALVSLALLNVLHTIVILSRTSLCTKSGALMILENQFLKVCHSLTIVREQRIRDDIESHKTRIDYNYIEPSYHT
ncbi:pyrophosphatase [Tanacetum coccineum]